MKNRSLSFMILCLMLLTGCATKPIMPPIEYNKPIDFRIDRNAVLYWEVGKQHASTVKTSHQDSLLGSVIESVDRERNPSRYLLQYGKAEQAIFMTSFRHILEKEGVFKTIELITNTEQVSPKDVFITLYFRSTRVSSPERGYQISLSVDMTIKGSGRPPFTRTYFVKSDESASSFQEQQSKVSTKLAENLVSGLKQWYTTKP